MSMDAARQRTSLTPFERLRFGRDVIRAEAEALEGLADRLGDDFGRAVDLLLNCLGSVIVTGMGKAGLIGQKIAATLASTGTRAHFLHPAEAVHGDLGRVQADDAILALSFSGETAEVTRILPSLAAIGAPLIAITGQPRSALAQAARVTLDLGPLREACWLGLAPSTSTTAMLALGDALALVVSRCRHFDQRDFARFHPGGNLGRQLAQVEEVMRPLSECRLALQTQSVRGVLVSSSRPGRRTGAIMLVDEDEMLTGLFTDSDLARMLERNQDAALDGPIEEVMTRQPTTVRSGTLLGQAVAILAARKISELPVVDAAGRPVGLLDITDVVGQPREVEQPAASSPAVGEDWRLRTVRFPHT
ncbi:MAG: KpsF/GutQ family sugar-phosphate isomerase [Pirellulaceae bacterium]|jgi:arabinose-5-phosphate isomerase|nr:KpsF/GutQ family sugar-phosphate isomerase [Pirellulaceae bacterium]